MSEEETQAISDNVLAEFESELNERINDETMPVSEKTLKKTFKEIELRHKERLRKQLAEIATFAEVM